LSTIHKEIGEKIRNYRKSKHYSTAELAERLNVSAGFINNLENGRNDVFKIELLNNVMKELDIPLEELFQLEPINLRLLSVDEKHNYIQLAKFNDEANKDIDLINKNLNLIIRSFLSTVEEYGCGKDSIDEITRSVTTHLEVLRNLKKL